MEAPVKVIHRDLKSRNGNVVMFLFYLSYYKIHASVYVTKHHAFHIFCSLLFWLTADTMEIFPLLINIKILYIIVRRLRSIPLYE